MVTTCARASPSAERVARVAVHRDLNLIQATHYTDRLNKILKDRASDQGTATFKARSGSWCSYSLGLERHPVEGWCWVQLGNIANGYNAGRYDTFSFYNAPLWSLSTNYAPAGTARGTRVGVVPYTRSLWGDMGFWHPNMVLKSRSYGER